jgi:hypothetical protein
MPKRSPTKRKDPPLTELYIQGEVESWHVLMVVHDKTIEVPPERAQCKKRQPDGGYLCTRRAVSDHFSLELDVALREPVRGFDRLQFSIAEWDAEEHGGIAGDLSYDKEFGLRGGLHMSGSFPRDLYALLLSGSRVALGVATKSGFHWRKAWVTSVAFSDAKHPRWIDEVSGLI